VPENTMKNSFLPALTSQGGPFENKNYYFAALNTSKGFVSKFDPVFSDASHTLILKGGPGTGKSTLISSIAAEGARRGLDVEYFLCSSDTSSLDGALIGGELAVIDGTSPHCIDPKFPGAVDERVNIGGFWDTSILKSARSEIKALCAQKSENYADVYKYMKISADADDLAEKLVLRHCDLEKMSGAVERLSRVLWSDTPEVRYRGISAFGTQGYIMLDSYLRRAKTVYSFRDRYGISNVFLALLKEKLDSAGIGYDYSLSPVREKLDALFLRGNDTAFITADCESGKIINTERFIKKSVSLERSEIKKLREISFGARSMAEKKLSEIGELHSELEKIYIGAMDFKEMNKMTRRLLISIFKNQGN